MAEKKRFTYDGFVKSGEPKNGYIDAETAEKAAEDLREKGIFVSELRQDGETMKNVVSGGKSLDYDAEMERMRQEAMENDRVAEKPVAPPRRIMAEGESGPAESKTLVMPKPDWKGYLQRELRHIAVVTEFVQTQKQFKELGLDLPELKKELVKAAILSAAKMVD